MYIEVSDSLWTGHDKIWQDEPPNKALLSENGLDTSGLSELLRACEQ